MNTNRARAATLAAAVLSTALLSAACGGSSTTSSKASTPAVTADGVTVNTGLLAFDPKTVNVKKGQTVTWVGGDNITHVLVEGDYKVGGDNLRTEQTDDKAFNLKLTKKGQQVSHTYSTTGTFTYYCTIHHGMNGTVVVS
ncbi:MAG: blue (type 1) copper domain protein [Frankiales bacterium]|jgi:plastocyanin|nr:blue (type 1) copper domain protein [Frankiales bacterium]